MKRTKKPSSKTGEDADAFKRRYDKLRDYKRSSNVNMEQYFHLPKSIISYSKLTKAGLAVYPVLCSRADFEYNEWFQLPQEHIARMTGMSIPTVNNGINDLVTGKYYLEENGKKVPLLKKKKVIEGKRHFYMYQIGFIRKDMIEEYRQLYFSFHRCIIDSGTWAWLTPRSKALYLALRTVAFFDRELYFTIEHDTSDIFDISGVDFDFKGDSYRNRKWDVCTTPLATVCRMINIESTNSALVINQLEHCGLIEKVGTRFKVYLKPNKMFRH